MRADWTASGACTSGSTARPRGATRRACGGAATTSKPTKARARAEARLLALADVDAIAVGQDSNETNWKQQVKILIEVFAAPGCSECAQKRQALRVVTEELGADRFDWQDINLLENIERA